MQMQMCVGAADFGGAVGKRVLQGWEASWVLQCWESGPWLTCIDLGVLASDKAVQPLTHWVLSMCAVPCAGAAAGERCRACCCCVRPG